MNKIFEIVEDVSHLTAPEQREILARLWTEQTKNHIGETWKTLKFSENLRITTYEPEQEKYLEQLRAELVNGCLARLENESDGTFEIFGSDRTYYVSMTISREFVGLLDSWSPENPPREINLEGAN